MTVAAMSPLDQSIMETRPDGAYRCWSYTYEDHNRECRSCKFNVSCKTAFNRRNGIVNPPQAGYWPSPPPGYQPIPQYQVPQYGIPHYQPQQPVSLPTQHAVSPPANSNQPRPAWEQQYGLTLYPGETLGERIFKNVVLKLAEVFFFTLGSELARFFRYYPWAPSPQNNHHLKH